MAGIVRGFRGLIRPSGVSLNTNSISIEETKTYQLIANITPSKVRNDNLIWSSSDTSIATVDQNGLVTAISAGSCTITVKTDDRGFTSICSCTIWVTPITSFQLNKSTTSITYGNTEQLSVTITPNDATYQGITWSSSNTSVATVDENGLVTPVWEGNCIITATSEDGVHSANCSVTVNLIHVTGISLNKNTLEVLAGKQQQLTATITPSNANVKTVTWSSSNTGVAVVDQTGLVTYVADGSCTITATTVDGGYTASCSVTCSSFTPVDRRFGYTGAQQSITLEPHKYCIEVWGAQGGSSYGSNAGAKGAYAAGTITLTSSTTLYIYVGGQGGTSNSIGCHSGISGGYNGGGSGGGTYYSGGCSSVGGGGGGTDVRYNGTTLCNRFIVAGGGAGGGTQRCSSWYYFSCGGGGGTTGCGTYGGTQTSAGTNGSFGQGANATVNTNRRSTVPGGGGGWYGGGGGSVNDNAGASSALVCASGGSSYTYTSSTCGNHPNKSCLGSLPLMTSAVCCGCSNSFPTASGGTETGHSGNGCVRIRSL